MRPVSGLRLAGLCGGLAMLGFALATRSSFSQQAAAPLAAVASSAKRPVASYDVAQLQDVMVPMRDGIRLATDIYLPARGAAVADGRFPVILQRTPYNKAGRDPSLVRAMVPRGYAVLVQDVRGRYRSEGRWQPLRDDALDGFDTAAWIGAQPWARCSIGTVGTSYDGATQHALAIAAAPCLKAMVPRNAMSNLGHYGVRHHGAFELRWLNWVLTLGNAADTANALPAAQRAAANPVAAPALVALGSQVQEYARNLPLRPGTTPLKLAPDYETWLIEAMSHGTYDRFWSEHGASVVDHIGRYKDVPVYHITGWYDSWSASVANLNYVALAKAKKSPQRLLIGPWIHSSEHLSYAGEAQFTADAAIDRNALQVRWFDRWLDGDNAGTAGDGVSNEAPVRIYVMGGGDAHRTPEGRLFVGGRWRDEQEWPLARTAYTPWYLQADGALTPAKPASGKPISFQFDPRDPVPTLGGNVSSQGKLMFQGAADQRGRTGFWLTPDTRPLSARNDVLVFQSAPLEADLEVTGRLVVTLWASSDARDTDFTVKLIDVYPPNAAFPEGVDLNVADGIVRARYRNELDREELLQPGRPYEFKIEMYPTSLLFQRGHRIRLDVSSSNFPRFDVNPNTGEPLNANRRWQVATNTIYVDATRPSHILLPVIPR